MVFNSITVLLIVLISYLQCSHVASINRLASYFRSRHSAAELKNTPDAENPEKAAVEDSKNEITQDWNIMSALESASAALSTVKARFNVDELHAVERIDTESDEFRERAEIEAKFALQFVAEQERAATETSRVQSEAEHERFAAAADLSRKISLAMFKRKQARSAAKDRERLETQARMLEELEKLKSAVHWETYTTYLQYPAERSLKVYQMNPYSGDSETTGTILKITADSSNITKKTSDSLFTVAKYIPHQLYRLASHDGNGYLCADIALQALIVRGRYDPIHRSRNVWCDWMKSKDPQQNYFVPIPGYTLYERDENFVETEISFLNSIYFSDEQTMDILNDDTLYITDNVNRGKTESEWTVEMKSTEYLIKDISFHHALQHTRFTLEAYDLEEEIIDSYGDRIVSTVVYIFTNTFEIKKKGNDGEKGSLCLCLEKWKLIVLACQKESKMCQWRMNPLAEGTNEVVFKSVLNSEIIKNHPLQRIVLSFKSHI